MAAAFLLRPAFILNIFVLLNLFLLDDAERTSHKIYKALSPNFACFRRLNGTHQIGCSSERSGNVGVVHYVSTVSDLDWLLERGPDEPYILLVEIAFFNFKNLTKMEESEKINGLLVLSPENSTTPENGFSADQSCPNRGHGLYDSLKDSIDGCSINWNPRGDAMFFHDWKFPIFLVRKQADVDSLMSLCYEKFNAPVDGSPRAWPLCAAQLSTNMYAARDAETCIRRSNLISNLNPVKVCDPLGDYNVWAPLLPKNSSTPYNNRSIVFVAARMDAFSMFDNIAPGGDTAVTGVVALLAAAEVLSSLRSDIEPKSGDRNVVFALFNGEAFDNIGSSRMVYDMQRGLFPSHLDAGIRQQPPLIGLQHISHFIELNQVGLSSGGTEAELWVHTDPISNSKSIYVNNTVEKLVNLLKSQSSSLKSFTVSPAQRENPLPPSSFQTFLKNDLEIPGVVLTDHELSYSNRYYNSFFDVLSPNSSTTEESVSPVDYVHSTATVIVRAVYALMTGEGNETLSASRDTVEQLLAFYSRTGNSTFASYTMFNNQPGRETAPNLYVGVDISMSEMRLSTNNLLAHFIGTVLPNVTSNECKRSDDNTIFSYQWIPPGDQGICVKSTVNLSKAVSPAFEIDGYDFTSTLYSTWTESVWDEHSLRIFLKPSIRQEVTTLLVGLAILMLSIAIVWFLNENSDVLFPSNGSNSATSSPTISSTGALAAC